MSLRTLLWPAAALLALTSGCGGVQRAQSPPVPPEQRSRHAYLVDPAVTHCVPRWNAHADPLLDELAANRRAAGASALVTRLRGRCLVVLPGSPDVAASDALFVEARDGAFDPLGELAGATARQPPAVPATLIAAALRRSARLRAAASGMPNVRVRLDGTLTPTDPDPLD